MLFVKSAGSMYFFICCGDFGLEQWMSVAFLGLSLSSLWPSLLKFSKTLLFPNWFASAGKQGEVDVFGLSRLRSLPF